ncbi:MAG: hypothetical protein H6R10_2707 [Rhodocyclaceae bacterium]|nr:hypothetical protein [Rhodocyclaceae bacterium]
MNPKLAGLCLTMGMSLAVQADTFHFTPITDQGNPLLQSLGNQLTVDVTQGGADNVLMTFSNPGNINSTIAQVYLDDSPVDLFSSVAVASQSTGVSFSAGANPGNLPGGNAPAFAFDATSSFGANPPAPTSGVNDSGRYPGEFLTLSATLNSGHTFADAINSLSAGNASNGNFLRIGAHVISIADLNDASASFLDTGTGGGAAPPPPIPEPETWGMLMAGLGFLTALARRRRKDG